MQLDEGLIRDLLTRIEGGEPSIETIAEDAAECIAYTPKVKRTYQESQKIEHHLKLLEDNGYISV